MSFSQVLHYLHEGVEDDLDGLAHLRLVATGAAGLRWAWKQRLVLQQLCLSLVLSAAGILLCWLAVEAALVVAPVG